MWYEISTAEIAPRQPLDSELFNKIRANLQIGAGCLNSPKIIPNGSFEFTTGVVPKLWETSAVGNGAATISTGAHGANSLKLTKTTGSTSGVAVYTEDYIPVGSTSISIHGYIWSTGATSTAINGGVVVRTFTGAYVAISTISTLHSSWSSLVTTYTMTFDITSAARFIKVGCVLGTNATVAGSLLFDGLYIVNT